MCTALLGNMMVLLAIGLEAVVRGDVESELLHIDHCSVLLLKQLCAQADKWHLKLQPDISELQNRYPSCYVLIIIITLHYRELLEEIARVEAQVFSEPFKVLLLLYLSPEHDTIATLGS